MSVADRLPEPLADAWEQDVVKVVTLLVILYATYTIGGLLLGYDVRSQLNSLALLSFYIGVFALLALALNLHWGYTGLFNIGIVGFMAVGIYVTAIISKEPMLAAETGRVGGFGLPLWMGIIGGMLAATLLGFVVALPALRLRADYLAIVTIAMSEIVRFTLLETSLQQTQLPGWIPAFGDYVVGLGGGSGLILDFDPTDDFLRTIGLFDPFLGFVETVARVLGIEGNNPKPVIDGFLYGIILLVFLLGFYYLLRRVGNSPFGRVLKAIREDEDATKSLGKDTNLFKIKSFMLGCGLMGLGGILFYMESGAITPNTFRPRLTFFVWIALIIGGAGSNTGSVMGGAIFAAVLFQGPRFLKNVIEANVPIDAASTFGQAIAPLFGSLDPVPLLFYTVANLRDLQLVFMGVVLILLMHRRPQGMLGHRKEPASGVPLDRPADTESDGSPPTITDGGCAETTEDDDERVPTHDGADYPKGGETDE